MRIIMMGPPGAGKGSQAKIIAKEYSILHISTGDMFRSALKNETPMGLKAKEFMDKGELVPDSVVNGLVEERISQDDCKNGYVLDGYPRTINQADALSDILEDKQQEIDVVISIDTSDETVIKRLTGRRVCVSCGAIYHVDNNPPEEQGVCDLCEGEVVQREDDKEETVRNRLEVYKKQTKPLIEYYEKKDLLVEVDGEQELSDVFADIKEILEANVSC